MVLLGCAHGVRLKLGNEEEGKNFAGMGTQDGGALVPNPCGLLVPHVFPNLAPDL